METNKTQLIYKVGDAIDIEEIYVGAWVSPELVTLINDGLKLQSKALIKTATFPKFNDPRYMHILYQDALDEIADKEIQKYYKGCDNSLEFADEGRK